MYNISPHCRTLKHIKPVMYILQEKTEEFVYKPIHPSMEKITQTELSIKIFTTLQEVYKLNFYTNIIKTKLHLEDSLETLKSEYVAQDQS